MSLKGALLNKDTNEIALMSSVSKNHDGARCRLIKSLHKDFKICQCKMIALIFWDELKIDYFIN